MIALLLVQNLFSPLVFLKDREVLGNPLGPDNIQILHFVS